MKNWKSNLGFLVFIVAYGWAVYTLAPVGVVSVTGYIALFGMLAMMFRSQITTELLGKLIDKLDFRK